MAQTLGVESNVLVGLVTMYIAPEGEALPDITGDDPVPNPWGGNWVNLGFTDGGVEVTYTPEFADIKVDDFHAPTRKILIGEALTLKVTMAEAILENYLHAVSAGLLTATSASSGVAESDLLEIGDGSVRIVAIGFQGEPPGRDSTDPVTAFRLLSIPRTVAVGEFGQSYTKGEKTIVPAEFSAVADVNKASGKTLMLIHDWTDDELA